MMPGHEVSNRHVSVARCRADRFGPRRIAAPHAVGTRPVARAGGDGVPVSGAKGVGVDAGAGGSVAGGSDGGGEARERTVRARVRRAARQVFARKPDCRMRTKPRGKMCWTKRRRNSMAVSVIVRRACPWA
jgi:hypothetical protein